MNILQAAMFIKHTSNISLIQFSRSAKVTVQQVTTGMHVGINVVVNNNI